MLTTHRIQLLTSIIRLLLTIIPAERGHKLAEEQTDYRASKAELFNKPPCSEVHGQRPRNTARFNELKVQF